MRTKTKTLTIVGKNISLRFYPLDIVVSHFLVFRSKSTVIVVYEIYSSPFRNLDFDRIKGIIDVEMSIPAQMRWDIDFAVQGRCPIKEVLRSGGQLLTNDQVMKGAQEFIKEVL